MTSYHILPRPTCACASRVGLEALPFAMCCQFRALRIQQMKLDRLDICIHHVHHCWPYVVYISIAGAEQFLWPAQYATEV